MKLSLLFLTAVTSSVLFVEQTEARGPLIWQEEFDFLDYSRWKHLITGWRGGNGEFEYYHNYSQNSYVRSGILYIKPSLTADRFGEDFLYNGTLDLNPDGCNVNWGEGCVITAGDDIINPIISARMVTEDSFSFTYGTVETRAKMPKGDWLWPAIWMKPTDNKYGAWPRSGEIDIVEVRGNNDFSCNADAAPYGRQRTGQTIHWGPSSAENRYRMTQWTKLNMTSDYSTDFHIYRLEWMPSGMQFFVDDALVGEVFPPAGGFWELGALEGDNIWVNATNLVMAPFDQRFYFLINVAVGGSFFVDGCHNVPYEKPWQTANNVTMRPFWEARDEWYPTWNPNTEDSAMQIDYIRVYALE